MDKQRCLRARGRRIRELREARNISQETFAYKAGLDRAYYGGVERGERNVSSVNLIRIAAALDVEVGALFRFVDELNVFRTKKGD